MATFTSDAERQAMAQVNEDVRKADEERRKAAVEESKKGSEAARKASLETLKEQEAMKPVPSQEGADAIKAGADPLENEEIKQPDGPAARAAAGAPDVLTRQLNPDGGGEYKTRSAAPQSKPQHQPQQHPKP